MSNALLSDVEARAERRRTRTRDGLWQALARQALDAAAAAPDQAEARRWLDRAHRLLPEDGTIALSLAGACLAAGDVAAARALFLAVGTRHATPEAWIGLATCAHLQNDPEGARSALAEHLRRAVPGPTATQLAAVVAGPSGWCGLTTGGVVKCGGAPLTGLALDGVPVPLGVGRGSVRLPGSWRRAAVLDVHGPHGPMLGSPIPLAPFAGVEGFVEALAGGVVGWAWHPVDPAQPPVLRCEGPLGARNLVARLPAEDVGLERPLAQPRRFTLTAAEVQALGTPLSVRGPDGRHLMGSPIDPGIEARAAVDPAHAGFAPVWADTVGPAAMPAARIRQVDVVIPVYRGRVETLACLGSVLGTIPRGTRVIVVEDASPDPGLVSALERLARRRRIVLLRLPENRGFPGAANAGIAAASGRDVVLLNSDTLVPPGWLERLRAAAYAAPDIATATPLTNDGTIVGYPRPGRPAAMPDAAGLAVLDTLAQRAAGGVVDVPVGVGFCLYLRRDCLDQVGLLREDLFAQGYGEENDLCLRARHAGWRNVAATNLVVGHVGATSFGPARAQLIRRNTAILQRLHPGYDALVARHIAEDPLRPARRRIDELRWAAARGRHGATILVTHAGGGGVERVVAERARRVVAAGQRAIVLRPHRLPGGAAVRVEAADEAGLPFENLVFPMPRGLDALVRLLRADRPVALEQHHMLGHHADVAGLAARLDVPLVVVVHDDAHFCPRIALVGPERRYCGEPEVPVCEACIADLGSLLEDDPPVRVLIDRSARLFAGAARVVAPSRDAAARVARHFPVVRPEVEAWEDDAALTPTIHRARGLVRRVVVVGAIGVEKGFEVLLACVRDAAWRSLPLEFVVVGFTADDERLMQAGPVFVTGEYKEAEAVALIEAQGADLALIPSVWPETWCFALSRAWQAGLPAAVFDLGAQAERVRATGRGWVLPLGLSARALNDALLRLAPDAPASQSPPRFARQTRSRER